MIKGVYGVICILIALYCLYIAEKCRRKKEVMAKPTSQVCLAGAVVVLCNSITLFSDNPMIVSIGFSSMFVCTNVFLVFFVGIYGTVNRNRTDFKNILCDHLGIYYSGFDFTFIKFLDKFCIGI